jgi:hypothetical protein
MATRVPGPTEIVTDIEGPRPEEFDAIGYAGAMQAPDLIPTLTGSLAAALLCGYVPLRLGLPRIRADLLGDSREVEALPGGRSLPAVISEATGQGDEHGAGS